MNLPILLQAQACSRRIALLEVAIAAKTYSKTDSHAPAPKKDRIKGSDKNEAGSASTEGGGIELSDALVKSLQNKVKEHNEKHDDPGKRTTLETLKKVCRRGLGAYSSSHRPVVQSRQQWGIARVNAFLHLLSTGRPRNPKYTTDNDLLPAGHPRSTKK